MRKKYLLLFLLIFMSAQIGRAQNNRIDSLSEALKKVKTDDQKGNILNELSVESYYRGNISDAIKYAKEALKLNENSKNYSGLYNSNFNLGVSYYSTGNYNNSLECFINSLKFSEKLKDKRKMAITYENIGLVHFELEHYSQAMKYYQKGLSLFDEMDDKNGAGYALNNIASVYVMQKQLDEALKCFFKALKYAEESDDERGMERCYSNIADIYHKRGDFLKALDFNFKVLKIEEKLKENYTIAKTYNRIGFNQVGLNKAPEAKKYFNKAVIIAKNISAVQILMESYKGLAAVDSSLKNYKSSMEYYKMYKTIEDSIHSQEKIRSEIQKQLQYEFEKKAEADSILLVKERQMELIRKENELRKRRLGEIENEEQKSINSESDLIVGIVIGIFFIGITFLFYWKSKKRKHDEK